MSAHDNRYPNWLIEWMAVHNITLWGVADLREFSTPPDAAGNSFPRAISFAMPMKPDIMASIQDGPNAAYADEYARVNDRINTLSAELAAEIVRKGSRAQPLAASVRSDPVNIKGDFPHKTAATRAGLGWVGRHCQLITRPFGSWIRLGTVFTDLDLPCGPPGGKRLLRPLHPLCGSLSGRRAHRRSLVPGFGPSRDSGCSQM